MPRTCTVCRHPDRAAIDRALISREPVRSIAARFGLTRMAVWNHSDDHLPAALVKAEAAREEAASLDLMARLRDQAAFGDKLREACARWLEDPDHPGRFDVGLRSDDVEVLYRERVGEDGWRPKRAKLSRLLAMVEGADLVVDRGETKYADPRELAVKILNAQSRQGDLIAKAQNLIGAGPGGDAAMLVAAVMQAVAPYPAAAAAVVAALRALREEHADARG
jgi:hypothetical protein